MRHTQSVGRPVSGSLQTLTSSGTAQDFPNPVEARKVAIVAAEPVHISFDGDATTSDPFVSGSCTTFKITPGETVSILQYATAGSVSIYELD